MISFINCRSEKKWYQVADTRTVEVADARTVEVASYMGA